MGKVIHRYADLRAAMRARNVSSQDLANYLELDPASISLRMTGKRPWRQDEMYAVLDRLAVDHSRLNALFPPQGVKEDSHTAELADQLKVALLNVLEGAT